MNIHDGHIGLSMESPWIVPMHLSMEAQCIFVEIHGDSIEMQRAESIQTPWRRMSMLGDSMEDILRGDYVVRGDPSIHGDSADRLQGSPWMKISVDLHKIVGDLDGSP